jgi:putative flippase GtrA
MSSSSLKQLKRFILVGTATVLIDFLIYRILVVPLDPPLSKAISFLAGSFFAYQFNRKWTFQAGNTSLFQVIVFAFVYCSSLVFNVVANSAILNSLPSLLPGRLALAFLAATVISASLNFLGMKLLVFRRKKCDLQSR